MPFVKRENLPKTAKPFKRGKMRAGKNPYKYADTKKSKKTA